MKELFLIIIMTFGQILGFAQTFTNLDFEQGDSFPAGWQFKGTGNVKILKQDSFNNSNVFSGNGEKFLKLSVVDSGTYEAKLIQTQKFEGNYIKDYSFRYYYYSADSSTQLAQFLYKGFNWNPITEKREFIFREGGVLIPFNRNWPVPTEIDILKFYSEGEGYISNVTPDSVEIEIAVMHYGGGAKTDILYIDNLVFEEQVASIANVAKLETKLFPNPCTSFFSIEMANSQFTSILLYNLQCQLIANLPYSAENRYDIGNLGCGVYTVVLANKQENAITRGKLVKM